MNKILLLFGVVLSILASSQQINAENLLTKKSDWQLENLKGKVKATETVSYKINTSEPENPLGVRQQTVNNIFNSKGFLIGKETVKYLKTFENRKITEKQYFTKVVFEYNEQNQLQSEKKYVGMKNDPIDSTKSLRTEYQYLDGSISVSVYNNFAKLSSLYEIFPAKESSVVSAVRTVFGGSVTNKREDFVYTYNKAKQLLMIQTYRNEKITASQEFKYSGRDLVKKSYQSGTSLDAGATEYSYNQHGDIKTEKRYSSRESAEVLTYHYTYEGQKNWIKKETKDPDGNVIAVEERKIIYY